MITEPKIERRKKTTLCSHSDGISPGNRVPSGGTGAQSGISLILQPRKISPSLKQN